MKRALHGSATSPRRLHWQADREERGRLGDAGAMARRLAVHPEIASGYPEGLGMLVQLTRWGNSLGLRIPQSLATQFGLVEGAQVQVEAEDDRLVILLPRQRYMLPDLVADLTHDDLAAAFDWGTDRRYRPLEPGDLIWTDFDPPCHEHRQQSASENASGGAGEARDSPGTDGLAGFARTASGCLGLSSPQCSHPRSPAPPGSAP